MIQDMISYASLVLLKLALSFSGVNLQVQEILSLDY